MNKKVKIETIEEFIKRGGQIKKVKGSSLKGIKYKNFSGNIREYIVKTKISKKCG